MNTNSPTMPGAGTVSLNKTPSKKSSLSKNILTLAVIQALACGSTALYAANITVTSATDVVAVDGNCTLREAIDSASGNEVPDCTPGDPGADTITFDNSLSGSTVTLAGSQLLIATDLTIDGDLDNDGTADITINANDLSRVIQVGVDSPKYIDVTLEGLTISGGDSGFSTGGGIAVRGDHNLTVSNSTISDNSSSIGGGGIAVGYGDLTITNSTVSDNAVSSGRGGGIVTSGNGIVTLTNSTVSNNTSSGSGGAIYAGYSEDDYSGTSLIIGNSTLSGNTTTGGSGGAIYATKYSSLNLTNSTLSGNTSDGAGGAIFTGDNLTLTSSTVSNNTATGSSSSSGGGIASTGHNSSINLTNSTISGNTAGINGGGIFVYGSYTSLNISNSTITENTAGNGGGLYMYQPTDFSIVNSILANNTQPNTTINDCRGGGTATTTNNLVTDNGANCGFTPRLNVDPALGPLTDNGGSTQTHMPLAGSPVLDAGDNVNCGTGQTIETDQRGAARDDGSCDIGAVEGIVSTVPSVSVQFDSSTATVSEDGTSITLNLTRSGDTVSAISVDYTTSDATATAPADYTANMNTLVFATGITSQSITIDITDDTDAESDENFSVDLSDVQLVSGSGIVEIGANASATVTITDDDTDTDTPTSPSSSALALSPWWTLLGFIGLLRRKFKS